MARIFLFVCIAIASVATAALADDAPVEDRVISARAALDAGRFEEAERIARGVIAVVPASSVALRIAGLAAFRLGAWSRARDWFQRELEATPERDPITWFNLAGADFKLERFTEAEREYLSAAEDERIGALALLNAGLAADGLGDWQQAERHYLAASASAARKNKKELADKAADLARQAAASGHDGAWRLAREGAAALKAGHAGAALELLGRARKEAVIADLPASDRADFDYSFGHALLAAGRTADAVAALRTAIARVPADPEYHYVLAVALHKSGDDLTAAAEFRAALDRGLGGADAAEAREFIASGRGATTARLTVDDQLSIGYDSNYPGGREILFTGSAFMRGAATAGQSLGSVDLTAEIEPRFRLAGRSGNGLFLGDRLNALLYFSAAADNFSLIENDLYLEGTVSPFPWLLLSAAIEGYLQTTGMRTFGLYQTGAEAWWKAVFYEGNSFATRLRYAFIAMDSLAPLYSYLGGTHHDAQLAQSLYLGAFSVTAGYTLHADLVGFFQSPSNQILGPAAESSLQTATRSPSPLYAIPYAYLGHDVGLDVDGDLARFHLTAGIHYERRDYLSNVIITPAPKRGFTKQRIDDRIGLELSLKRELFWKLACRVGVYALISGSNINNTNPLTPYDYDDRNYSRVLFNVDLQRPF